MTVEELKSVLNELPAHTPVHVIMDGEIDENPDYNVTTDINDNPILYIEGVNPAKK